MAFLVQQNKIGLFLFKKGHRGEEMEVGVHISYFMKHKKENGHLLSQLKLHFPTS